MVRSAVVAGTVVAAVLAVAPAALAEDAPAAGDTVVGELVQAWPEHEDADDAAAHAAEGPLSWIATDSGDSVRVPTADVAQLPLGATVQVTLGGEVRDAATREDGLEPAQDVVASDVVAPAEAPPVAPASAPYTDEVTVALVTPAGLAADGTDVNALVGTVNGAVADFWESQTGGAIKIHATAGAPGWLTSSVSCNSPYDLWEDVRRQLSWTPGAGKHLLLYVPGYPAQMPSCAYGLAQVSPSRNYGGYAYVRDTTPSVIAHELGHNFSLGHSSSVQCDSTVEVGSCRTNAYDDLYDVMGYSWDQLGSLNAAQAARLGVLGTGQAAVSSSGSYTLSPLSGTTGTRALSMQGPDGTVYWLEDRPSSGQDGWISSTTLDSGVLLRRASTGSDTSLLLDGTPSPRAGWDADVAVALPVNTAVPVDDGAFSVTVQSATSSGATLQISVDSPLAAAYTASGGASGPLGTQTIAGETCGGLYPSGCVRTYQNGFIFWSLRTRAQVVLNPIAAEYTAMGEALGPLGYPVGPRYGTANGGYTQPFQYGRVHWSPTTGAHAVYGAISQAYDPLWGESGVLGYPVGEAYNTPGSGLTQAFQFGRIHFSPGTGAHAVFGPMSPVYDGLWGESGALGYPVGDRYPTANGGFTQAFQNGRIHWSQTTGAHAVLSDIGRAYDPLWGESGALGYPVGDRYPTANGGFTQAFQNGRIHWSQTTGAHAVLSDIGRAYDPLWGESGVLGYPVGDRYPTPGGGWTQAFQAGRIHWSPATGAHAVYGDISREYDRLRGESGVLGYPVTERYPTANGGFTQAFQNGRIHWSPTTNAYAVTGAISRAYDARGGEGGRLGYPVTGQTSYGSTVSQNFQHGRIAVTGTSLAITYF
nr:hypothetical protein [Petropleomorpha daqingensis]